MIGLLRMRMEGRKGRIRVERAAPFGLPAVLVTATAPEGAGPGVRRELMRCAGRVMERLGVGLVVPEAGVAWPAGLEGFRRQDAGRLIRAKAVEAAIAGSRGRERALLCADRADRQAAECFAELAEAFRHVSADVPEGDMEILERAGAALGAVPEPVGRGRHVEADAAVFLAPPARPVFLPARCRTMQTEASTPAVCGGVEAGRIVFSVPERYRDGVPEGFGSPELLSLALESGRIGAGEIEVVEVGDV